MVYVALLIFTLRMLDVTAATLRMLMVMRGEKLYAWILGFFQAALFVIAIRAVLGDISGWMSVVGFAAGYATGTVMGMFIEERLAIGHTHLRIISSSRGSTIAQHLREHGYAVTELPGRGKDGAVSLLNCTVRRKDVDNVKALIQEKDDQAFITADDVKPVLRGFWGM